ncbi:MAG: hypothetical protein Q8L81_08245 [Bacteroidota bacterium]|nr:hypothetical protein [Bacteroidota bacterium]
MDRYTAIEYAKQRMRELGIAETQYHIKPEIVIGSQRERFARQITIDATNKYYYLIHYWLYSGLEIISDTGYFNSDDFTNNTIQEFTGVIIIKQLPGKIWSLDNTLPDGGGVPTTQKPLNFITVSY